MITIEFRSTKMDSYPAWKDSGTQFSLEVAKAEVLDRRQYRPDNEYRIREEAPATYQVVIAKAGGGYNDSARKPDASSEAAFEYIRANTRDYPVLTVNDHYAVQERPGKVIYHYYQPAQWRTE